MSGEGQSGDAAPDAEPQRARDTTRSSAVVAAGIFLSRIAGLLREMAIAYYLGNRGVAVSAFRAAMRIPKLLQNLLGEGALSAAFIPVYARLLEEGDEEDAGRVAGAVAALIGVTTAVLVLAGALLARPITAVVAFGFEADVHELTVDLVRIAVAGTGFVVLSAWCLGVLNAHRRFFLSYVSPVVWNAAQVAALVTAGTRGWTSASIAEAAAWGVLVGGVLQFLVQVPAVRRIAPTLRVSLRTDLPGVRDVLGRFTPAVIGRGVVQIGAYLDVLLASFLSLAALGALEVAQILFLLPISLFAISVAAAELPELSRTTDPGLLIDRVDTGLRRVAFLLMFTAAAYVVVGRPIVGTLFERGRFDGDDTLLVWLVLASYSLGLVAAGLSRLVQNLLFSQGDTVNPAKLAAVRVAVAAAIGVALMFQLDRFVIVDGSIERIGELPAFGPLPSSVRLVDDAPPHLGAIGLALGSAAAAWVELLLLSRRTRRSLGVAPAVRRTMAPLVLPTAGAVVCMTVVGSVTSALPLPVVALLGVGPAGLAYVAIARRAGVPEASQSLRSLRARL